MIPSEAGLDSDRELDRIHYRACYLKHLGDVSQHSCSCSFACYFLDRTSEIDVYYVRTCLFYNLGGLNHRLDLSAIYLNSCRTFSGINGEFADCGWDVANKSVGTYEFGVHH